MYDTFSSMKTQSGYALSMLLITMTVSVLLATAVARVVGWSIRSVRAAQTSARSEMVSASAWNQLITDCLCASTQRIDWVHDGLYWVYRTPKQWVCWFVRDGALFRRYGAFDNDRMRWGTHQTERVLGIIHDLQIAPQFENQHMRHIALRMTIEKGADAYRYQTTLY